MSPSSVPCTVTISWALRGDGLRLPARQWSYRKNSFRSPSGHNAPLP